MNISAPPLSTEAEARRSNLWFVVITVILSLFLAANMLLIFCMSAESPSASGDRSQGITDVVVDMTYPDIQQRPVEEQNSIFRSVHHLVRKMAHFLEFALLGFLSALLIFHISRRLTVLRLWLQLAIPVVFTLLYAISDEVHQIFTDRGPAVKDVLIDFSGALTGILLARLVIWIAHRMIRVIRARRAERVCAA